MGYPHIVFVMVGFVLGRTLSILVGVVIHEPWVSGRDKYASLCPVSGATEACGSTKASLCFEMSTLHI